MRIGIVGAGTIGVSLAYALSEAGTPVLLIDSSQSALESAPQRIRENAKLHRLRLRRSSVDAQSTQSVIACIELTSDLETLENVDIVVENIVEDIGAKMALHGRLLQIVDPKTVLAVNTSAISVDLLSKGWVNPELVVGVHFMNPVSEIRTTEVIRGSQTADYALDVVDRLLKILGNKAVVVGDRPGFVSNRISHLFMNEAALAVEEGVADAGDVDAIFEGCFSHRMGPLRTADLIGLDTVVHTLNVLCEQLDDDRFSPASILRSHVTAGRLGRKSGQGFFVYDPTMKARGKS